MVRTEKWVLWLTIQHARLFCGVGGWREIAGCLKTRYTSWYTGMRYPLLSFFSAFFFFLFFFFRCYVGLMIVSSFYEKWVVCFSPSHVVMKYNLSEWCGLKCSKNSIVSLQFFSQAQWLIDRDRSSNWQWRVYWWVGHSIFRLFSGWLLSWHVFGSSSFNRWSVSVFADRLIPFNLF